MVKKYSRKQAFTLAEVLITIIVIGVVAMLVIPPLVNAMQEAALKSQWKETYSLFNQAAQKFLLDNPDVTSLHNYCAYDHHRTFCRDAFLTYLKYVKKCDDTDTNRSCFSHNAKFYDGVRSIDNWDYVKSNGAILANGSMFNYDYGAQILVDVNGEKGPNIVGKDIFSIIMQDRRLVPDGAPGTYEYSIGHTDCPDAANLGYACSAVLLQQ